MSDSDIRNCKFAFKCSKRWDDLREVEGLSERVRICDECEQRVYFCTTTAQLASAIRDNLCVAVSVSDPKSGTVANFRSELGVPAPFDD